MDTLKAEKVFQALEQFHVFKSKLLPEFAKRNKRELNLIESRLTLEYNQHMQIEAHTCQYLASDVLRDWDNKGGYNCTVCNKAVKK
jgi:hypothetical protein